MQRDVKVGLVLGVLLVAVVAVVFFRRDDNDRDKFAKLLPGPDAVADRARGMLGPSQSDPYPVNSEYLAGTWQGGSTSKQARTPTPQRNKNGEMTAQVDAVDSGTDRSRKDNSVSAVLQPPEFDQQRSTARSKAEPLIARAGSTRSGSGSEYTIQEGDTLSDIARRKLGSANAWKQILDENKDVLSDESHIPVGKTIRIPTGTKQERTVQDRLAAQGPIASSTAVPSRGVRGNAQEPAKTTADPAGSHTVKDGDTLIGIAKKYYGQDSKYLEILRANPTLGSPGDIRPGMVLKLP